MLTMCLLVEGPCVVVACTNNGVEGGVVRDYKGGGVTHAMVKLGGYGCTTVVVA